MGWSLVIFWLQCLHGLVRPSILVAAARAPRWTCAVPCVYTRSLASVGNVYPAEVQQCWAFSQLYWTHWSGSHLGFITDRYPGLSEVSRCIKHLKKEFLVLKLCIWIISFYFNCNAFILFDVYCFHMFIQLLCLHAHILNWRTLKHSRKDMQKMPLLSSKLLFPKCFSIWDYNRLTVLLLDVLWLQIMMLQSKAGLGRRMSNRT